MFTKEQQKNQENGYNALKHEINIDSVFELNNTKSLEFINSKDHQYINPKTNQPYLVLIFPGGGYEFTSYMESYQVALAFAKEGLDSAVFRYTTRPENEVRKLGTGLSLLPLTEVAQAIDELRNNPNLGYTNHKIIVCGFSAGGHLASCISTMYDYPKLLAQNNFRDSVRPDGTILCYPVISGNATIAHATSLYCLTGSMEQEKWLEFSTDLYVDAKTPPAFIWTTADDHAVSMQNALAYAQAMWQHGNIADLRVFPTGVHGSSLATPNVTASHDFFLADPYKAVWHHESCEFVKTYC